MRFVLLAAGLFAFASLQARPAEPVTSAARLIEAMQRQYGRTWYRTATFVQKTTNVAADGTSKVSTWYEALEIPGRLRIDFAPVDDGNGILFADGKIFQFKNGTSDGGRPYVHPLLLLGFDIYRLPPATVLTQLSGLKIDTARFHEDVWQGRPVYVVGAAAGDGRSAQFWIDRDRLYFVRLLQPTADGSKVRETQFNKYQPLGGGWMSPEVVFKTDGVVTTTEEYSELRGDVALPDRLFEPAAWMTVRWRK